MGLLKYILLLLTTVTLAQTKFSVTGRFNQAPNKQIALRGYNAQQEIKLAESTTDSDGNFSLQYPEDYVGAALMEIKNGKSVIVLLDHENFEIQWDNLDSVFSLKFFSSAENTAFDQGLQLYQNTQEKSAGILYLLPYYANDPEKSLFFTTELKLLTTTMANYLNKLPDSSYVSYYLKIRILIADLQISAKRNVERLPELEKQFNSLDFSDERLLRSGLYNELLETYFAAMENYGDKKSTSINTSIDTLLESLKSQPGLKQDIAEYLFNLLEKRSLFDSSEHLALAMLGDDTCQLDDKHKALFEQYRKMAIGNIAPDIKFTMPKNGVQQLSSLKNKYKLVVFGASWCPKCTEEIPTFKPFYADWKKNYKVEIVFISLDTQNKEFVDFTKSFPWISSCDFKGWESKPVVDYSVFATPTMYLLDSENKIRLKPVSAEQVNAWLEFHK